MKRMLGGAVALGLCLVLVSCSQRKQAGQTGSVAEPAKQFVALLAKGDFSKAVTGFDGTMRRAMPAADLAKAWASLTAKLGAFQKQTAVRTAQEQGYDVAYVRCQFEKGDMDVKVVFSAAPQISGLWFVPPG